MGKGSSKMLPRPNSRMIHIADSVARDLETGAAVVALESTIFSHLGLPSPANAQALRRCLGAVRKAGATPAVTAVLNGVPTVGVADAEAERICGPATKMASRDIATAVSQKWTYGASTVSAALTLAAAAGVSVFATGGIGGVHRDVNVSGDISADLPAIAKHQVVTVCAGAKVFLDLPRTVEYLETLAVPVVGWQCDYFPAFHAVSSGLPVPQRADSAEQVAALARTHWALGGGGILVVAPVPASEALPLGPLEEAVARALVTASEEGVKGAAVTPRLLAALAEVTDGATIAANLALAENNASVAGDIAVALAK